MVVPHEISVFNIIGEAVVGGVCARRTYKTVVGKSVALKSSGAIHEITFHHGQEEKFSNIVVAGWVSPHILHFPFSLCLAIVVSTLSLILIQLQFDKILK